MQQIFGYNYLNPHSAIKYVKTTIGGKSYVKRQVITIFHVMHPIKFTYRSVLFCYSDNNLVSSDKKCRNFDVKTRCCTSHTYNTHTQCVTRIVQTIRNLLHVVVNRRRMTLCLSFTFRSPIAPVQTKQHWRNGANKSHNYWNKIIWPPTNERKQWACCGKCCID